MKYMLTVKPNAKSSSIKQISETELRIEVKAPAHEGKANKELTKVLAKFLRIPQSSIKIIRGVSGRKKVIEIV